jgi:DUF1680 family protein
MVTITHLTFTLNGHTLMPSSKQSPMSNNMKEVKVTFLPADLDRLNTEAAQQGISRAQLIRDRALKDSGKSGNVRFDRDSYAKAVEAAARTVPGIPRAQLEHAVAKVINSIAS